MYRIAFFCILILSTFAYWHSEQRSGESGTWRRHQDGNSCVETRKQCRLVCPQDEEKCRNVCRKQTRKCKPYKNRDGELRASGSYSMSEVRSETRY
ncbi:unnamed protein product [Calicophoron daubneyi]|uniref:Uncharacterized protein n=1 Tax=Calicophoron daubneyi TaxID=300641 RepID=A0AAV2TFI7_CALDB